MNRSSSQKRNMENKITCDIQILSGLLFCIVLFSSLTAKSGFRGIFVELLLSVNFLVGLYYESENYPS